MLEKRIDEDLKRALKERDAVRVSTLRMLRSEIINTKIKLNKNELKDDEVVKVAEHQIKQHRDSIEQFKIGNRQDLVDKEEKELEILLSYIPPKLSPDKARALIEETIKELGATSKKDMGNVIKSVLEKAKGTLDGKELSRIVSELLK